jgi:peptide/nickel transport system permease protein
VARSFRATPSAIIAAFVATLFIALALLAPWIAQQNPYDPASYDILSSDLPPVWMAGGDWSYLLGTDDQGRSLLALILYGMRISMFVGFASIALAMVAGTVFGLISGYFGGWIDAGMMRVADIQMSFPPILVALLVDGVARAALPASSRQDLGLGVLIFAIAVSKWVLFARTVRSSVMVETRKEYVQAAHLLFRNPFAIIFQHILPNTLGPLMVLGTVNFAMAILTEATLSFLGTGVPPTTPSLGTLIKIGNDYLFSGSWWITLFPGFALIAIVFSFNVLGDWLRDALNPRLR